MPEWKKNKKPLLSSAKYIKQMSKFKNSVVLVDLRPESDVEAGHIKGSTAIAAATLSTMKDKFPAKKNAPVVIIAADDATAKEGFATIRGWGFKNASILKGGIAAANKAELHTVTGKASSEIVYVPKPIPGAMGVDDFKSILAKKAEDTVILDVRTEEEAVAGAIPGSINIPTEEVAERLSEIPKDKQIITYCSTGIRAEMAYLSLKDNGYKAQFLNAKTDFAENGKFEVSEN